MRNYITLSINYIQKLADLLTKKQNTPATTSETQSTQQDKKIDIFSSQETFNDFVQKKSKNPSIFSQDVENIEKMDLSEENIEKLSKDEKNKDKDFYSLLNEMYDDPLLKDLMDENNDDKISNEEAQKFFESIKDKDGDDKNLTIEDFTKFMEEVAEKQKTLTANNIAQENTSQQNAVNSPSYGIGNSNGINGGDYGNYGGGYGNYGGGYGNYGGGYGNYGGVSPYATPAAPSPEEQKTKIEAKINEYNTELSKIDSGENEAVKKAIKDKETAEAKMKEQLEKDDKVSQELKTKYNDLSKNISDKEKEISATSSEITKTEAELSKGKNNLSSLQNALSSLPAPSGKPEDKQADAKLAQRKANLQKQIEEQKSKLEELDKKLNDKENGLKAKKETLEKEKSELEKQRNEVKTEIEKGSSEATKAAIKAFEEAEKNIPIVKEAETSKVKTNIETAQAELKKINDEIQAKENKKATSNWDFNFNESLTGIQAKDLAKFKANFERNRARYEAVSKKTGVPAELIAALHWRESGGNFNTYLHNGQRLGQVTTIVPRNILFNDWDSAAVHALTYKNYGKATDGDLNSCLAFAERYNGLGYRKRGVASPYVWSGTTNYSGGKFVRDGVYNPWHRDQQLGVAVMMKAIC